MSVSLYYTAKRDYPFGDIYEGFCVYDLNELSEQNVIFEGATKLPFNKGKDHFIKVHDYWSDCLQEIIYLLSDAQWDIHIDEKTGAD